MRPKTFSWLPIALFLLSTLPAPAAAPPPRPEAWARPVAAGHLDNLYRIDDRLYRSEQPDRTAMQEIERLGIRTVINLRQFHDDEDEATGSDLHLVRIPMNAGAIRNEDVARVLREIRRAEGPVLVHCWHGADRTGTIVAMYRMIEQGWSREEAIRELTGGGYGYHAVYGNIIDYLRRVDIEEIRARMAAP